MANGNQEVHSTSTAFGLNNNSPRMENEHLKATNFPANLLRIGKWEVFQFFIIISFWIFLKLNT